MTEHRDEPVEAVLTLKDVQAIDRPHPNQLKLYLIGALLGSVMSCFIALPIALLALIPLLIRYYTMRYRFDENGVGVSYGWLFRHESYLTFEKIQDIHLNRGLLERWLGLGTVDIQTASGNFGAEISLIGLTKYDGVRDFLYQKMRRRKRRGGPDEDDAAKVAAGSGLALLQDIRDEVRSLRAAVENRSAGAPAPGTPAAGTPSAEAPSEEEPS